MTLSLKEIKKLVSAEQIASLHEKGYEETARVIVEFVESETHERNHWVCDSAPGHGKTTALTNIVQKMATQKKVTPLLLVFNNSDNLRRFYNGVREYCVKVKREKFIQYVDTNNFQDVIEGLNEYPILCIMHQRLKNIGLGISKKESYLTHKLANNSYVTRKIIIDEMPIFLNECTFDISSESNSVDWFDEVAYANDLESEEIRFGRSIIMLLVNNELFLNIGQTTLYLKRSIEGSQMEKEFDSLMTKLDTTGMSNETSIKYMWFKRLLVENSIGVIERHLKGSKIICAERIDYRELGDILVLDGTSSVTKELYNNEYQFKKVKNYHNYNDRLYLHFREINTSASNRKELEVTNTIANDIIKIRNKDTVFPLMNKDCVDLYLLNGVITKDQKKFFSVSESSDADMPLNLLNTVGKNVLNNYNSLALLNLPIRNPVYYKKIAISLLGTDVDLTMSTGNKGHWFRDEKVQKIFEEVVLADILQIIHRSNLRNINAKSIVNIYLYTNRNEWSAKLKVALDTQDKNITKMRILDNYHERFLEDCKSWASRTKEYLLLLNIEDVFKSIKTKATDVGGKKFKDWLNNNWKDEERKAKMIDLFSQADIDIVVSTSSYKSFKLK